MKSEQAEKVCDVLKSYIKTGQTKPLVKLAVARDSGFKIRGESNVLDVFYISIKGEAACRIAPVRYSVRSYYTLYMMPASSAMPTICEFRGSDDGLSITYQHRVPNGSKKGSIVMPQRAVEVPSFVQNLLFVYQQVMHARYNGPIPTLKPITSVTEDSQVLKLSDLELPAKVVPLAPLVSSTQDRPSNASVLSQSTGSSMSTNPEPILPSIELPGDDEFEILPGDLDYVAVEGKEYYVMHRAKERNKKIVVEKKKQSLKKDPLLRCEICAFSFIEKYGKWGEKFAEVHHKMPLSSLRESTKTNLADLSIVCSNCHRMLHRKGHRTLEVDELKCILAEKKGSVNNQNCRN